MSTSSCPEDETLRLLIRGLIDEAAEENVFAHCATCTRCEQKLEAFEAGFAQESRIPSQLMEKSLSDFHLNLDAAFQARESPKLLPESVIENGTHFGPYKILREIGRGGMGVVYEAQHESLERRVAVKILPHVGTTSRTRELRFLREARAAAQLHHTNIVPVFEIGIENGVPFYAMQLIDGVGLDQLRTGVDDTAKAQADTTTPSSECQPTGMPVVRQESAAGPQVTDDAQNSQSKLPARFIAGLGQQAASALAYAHSQGIIHRDVKPSNLLLDSKNTLWLADFGLAKHVDDDLTATTDAPGTLRYMSPERFKGICDERSDVYSLGVTLYETLAGRVAFDANDPLSLLKQINETQPSKLRSTDPSIPRDLETIVHKAMAHEPAQRYATASELEEDLTRFLNLEPIAARRVGALERAWLWARKNRVAATLLTGFLCLLLTSAIGGVTAAVVFQNQSLENAQLAKDKNAESAEAKQQRDVAFQNAYFADIRQAYQDWENGQLRRMMTTLRSYLPVDGRPDVRGWEWYYLLSLPNQNVTTITDFEGQALQVEWSPDGQQLISAHSDGTLRFWDRAGKPQRKISMPGLRQFVLSEDGGQAITVSGDPVLRFWDLVSGKLIRTIKTDFEQLRVVDWHSQTNRVALGGLHSNVQAVLIDGTSGEYIHRWKPEWKDHFGGPIGIAISPNGERVLIRYLRWLDLRKVNDPQGKSIPYRPWDMDFVSVAWLPDSQRCITSGPGVGARMVHFPSGKPAVFVAKFGVQTYDALAVSADGERVYMGNRGQRIGVVDIESKKERRAFKGHLNSVLSVAVDRDETKLASASHDGALKIWDLKKKAKIGAPKVASGAGESPDGRWKWRQENNRVIVSDTKTSEVLIKFEMILGPISAKYFPKVDRVLFWDWSDKTCPYVFAVIDTKSWRIVTKLKATFMSPPWASVGGDFAAVTRSDGSFVVFDGRTGNVQTILAHQIRNVMSLGFSPDATKLATALRGEVKLWDTETMMEEASFYGQKPGGEVPWICWDHAGRFLATASEDQTIKIWDTHEKKLKQTLLGLQRAPAAWHYGFSLDDKRFTAVDQENQRVWDVDSGREILRMPAGPVWPHKLGYYRPLGGNPTADFFDKFETVNSVDKWGLTLEELRFEALAKADAMAAEEQRVVEEFKHSSQHDLARSLLASSAKTFAPERALTLSAQALEQNPTSTQYLLTHALAQYYNKQYSETLSTLKLAEDSGAESVLIGFLRAECLRQIGKREQSLEILAKAKIRLDENPGDKELDRALIRQVALGFFDAGDNMRDRKAIKVNTLSDELSSTHDDRISLREAVLLADEGGRIEIEVEGTISLRYGPILIDKSLTILGPGHEKISISGNDASQLFEINDHRDDHEIQVHMRGLRFTKGRALRAFGFEAGGGIVSWEELTVEDSQFDNNDGASSAGAVFALAGKSEFRRCHFFDNYSYWGGGAIRQGEEAALQVDSCTFEANRTDQRGAAIQCGGSESLIVNTTFAGNMTKLRQGGAVLASGFHTRIDHCTFTGNRGSAITMLHSAGQPVLPRPKLTLTNSILFGNTDCKGEDPLDLYEDHKIDCVVKGNIVGVDPTGVSKGNSNLTNVDPKLGMLSYNGGLTKTVALLPGSPAIDAASPESSLEFDQRGRDFPRSVDGNSDGEVQPDIGAFELQHAGSQK